MNPLVTAPTHPALTAAQKATKVAGLPQPQSTVAPKFAPALPPLKASAQPAKAGRLSAPSKSKMWVRPNEIEATVHAVHWRKQAGLLQDPRKCLVRAAKVLGVDVGEKPTKKELVAALCEKVLAAGGRWAGALQSL